MRVLIAVGAALVAMGVTSVALSQEYFLRDIGTLPGGIHSQAHAINAFGHVTGWASAPDNPNGVAILWTPGAGLARLGTLGGTWSIGYGINDSDWIVGTSTLDNGDSHPFLWRPGIGMIDLGTLGGRHGHAYDVNNAGQVVGEAMVGPSGQTHAFLWTLADGMRDLGTLGGSSSVARAVGENGDVVGTSSTENDVESHAFLWSGELMSDLGMLPDGISSTGAAINAAGEVAGSSAIPGGFCATYTSHAFIYRNGAMQDIHGLGCLTVATSISNLGTVVGTFGDGFGHYFPFVYRDDEMVALHTLDDSDWALAEAFAINGEESICGWGYPPASSQHGFVLNPGCPRGQTYEECRDAGSSVLLFAPHYAEDAGAIPDPAGEPVYFDRTRVMVTRDDNDRFWISGSPDPENRSKWACDDRLYVNDEYSCPVGFNGIRGEIQLCRPIDSVLVTVDPREITHLIPPGTNCVTFRLADTERQIFGNTAMYLVKRTIVGVGDGPVGRSQVFAPWPNPTSGNTTFAGESVAGGRVEVLVIDLVGRRIRTLASGAVGPGRWSVVWNGRDERGAPVPEGIYFARIVAGESSAVRRLAIIR